MSRSDDLKADRQVAVTVTAAHADCRVAAEVEGWRERHDVQRALQRLAVDLLRPLAACVNRVKGECWRQQQVVLLEEVRELVDELGEKPRKERGKEGR